MYIHKLRLIKNLMTKINDEEECRVGPKGDGGGGGVGGGEM